MSFRQNLKKKVEHSRMYMKTITEVLLLTAKQNIKMHPDSCRDRVTGGGHERSRVPKISWPLPVFLRFLHDIDVGNSGERSVEAQGLLVQVDLMCTATLVVCKVSLTCFKHHHVTLHNPCRRL